MRTLIVGLIIFILFAICCRWYYVCIIYAQCPGCQTSTEDVRLKTLTLADNDEIVLKDYDQFKFAQNSFVPVLNANNKDFITQVKAFMKENPGKKLTITGNYLPSEIDKTGKTSYGMFENIGLARANEIRKLLVSQGVDGNRIGIAENRILLDHNLLPEGATLDSPISFRASGEKALSTDSNNANAKPDGYEQGGQAFTFTHMSFSDANFDLGSAVFKPGPAFISYADSVKTYMSLHEDEYLILTGHTCDKGSDQFNMNLGDERAKSVKRYFKNLGIKAKIETGSKGETAPAYPNTSESNRSKNRRVVVQIK